MDNKPTQSFRPCRHNTPVINRQELLFEEDKEDSNMDLITTVFIQINRSRLPPVRSTSTTKRVKSTKTRAGSLPTIIVTNQRNFSIRIPGQLTIQIKASRGYIMEARWEVTKRRQLLNCISMQVVVLISTTTLRAK